MIDKLQESTKKVCDASMECDVSSCGKKEFGKPSVVYRSKLQEKGSERKNVF